MHLRIPTFSSLTKNQKGVYSLILLAFIWGMIAITARYVSRQYLLYQQLYFSLGIGFFLSVIVFPRTLTIKRLQGISKGDWIILFLRVIVGYVIGAALYRQSLIMTKISNVTFIQSIPLTGIFGFLFFKEIFTLKKAGLLLIAYLGILLIAVKDFTSLSSFGTGELFALISAVFFSLSFVSRKWMSNYLRDTEIAQLMLGMGAALMLVISAFLGEGLPHITWQWLSLTALFFTGFFNVINLYLVNYGFKNVKAVLASNILTLEAIFAMFLAIIFYWEFPNIKELIGGTLIIISVLLMNHLEQKQKNS